MKRRLLIVPLVILAVSSPLEASDFTGKVVGVTDGDTLTLLHNGGGETTRLHGIDCPEKRQAFGQRAKQAASVLAFGKDVTVQTFGRDRYCRTIGRGKVTQR